MYPVTSLVDLMEVLRTHLGVISNILLLLPLTEKRRELPINQFDRLLPFLWITVGQRIVYDVVESLMG